MLRIFGFDTGDYRITDESSLDDFTGVDNTELPDIHRKIREVFGLDVSDLKAGKLLEIFVTIHARRSEAK